MHSVTRIGAEGFGLPSGLGLDPGGGLREPKSRTLPRQAGRGTRKGAVAGAAEGRQTHLRGAAGNGVGARPASNGGRRERGIDEGSQEALFMI